MTRGLAPMACWCELRPRSSPPEMRRRDDGLQVEPNPARKHARCGETHNAIVFYALASRPPGARKPSTAPPLTRGATYPPDTHTYTQARLLRYTRHEKTHSVMRGLRTDGSQWLTRRSPPPPATPRRASVAAPTAWGGRPPPGARRAVTACPKVATVHTAWRREGRGA